VNKDSLNIKEGAIMAKKLVFGILCLILVTSAFLYACSATPTAVPTTTAVSTTTAAPVTKTIKVGLIENLGFDRGIQGRNTIQVLVDMDNAEGGILAGGVRYKVDLVVYDTGTTQATEVAAVNRLVSEEKVSMIIGEGQYTPSWLPVVEANKILALASDPTMSNMDPKWNYSFAPLQSNTNFPILTAMFIKNHPDLVKNWVLCCPDNMLGHFIAKLFEVPSKALGVTINQQFYPAAQADLSALGTKVMSLNPTCVSAATGTNSGDALVMNAAWDAGYRGQLFNTGTPTVNILSKVMIPAAMEGMITSAQPVEFDPPLTPMAQAFKAAYIAKVGKWDDPNTGGVPYYSCFKAALQAAGSPDTDALAKAIGSGLKFTALSTEFLMIARPDLNNPKTVSCVCEIFLKTIKNGKPVLTESLKVDDSAALWNEIQAKSAKAK
jgi:ABC-type branched-subunit amino acid transport system substrate-binding protein